MLRQRVKFCHLLWIVIELMRTVQNNQTVKNHNENTEFVETNNEIVERTV